MNKKELKIEKITASNKIEYEEQLDNLKNKEFDILLFCYKSYLPIKHYKKHIPANPNVELSEDDYWVDLLLLDDDQTMIDTLKEELLDLSKKVSKPIIVMNEEATVGAMFVAYANYFSKEDETNFMWTTGPYLSDASNLERNIFSKRDIEHFKAIKYKGLKLGLLCGLQGYDEEKHTAFYKINKGIDYIIEGCDGTIWRY